MHSFNSKLFQFLFTPQSIPNDDTPQSVCPAWTLPFADLYQVCVSKLGLPQIFTGSNVREPPWKELLTAKMIWICESLSQKQCVSENRPTRWTVALSKMLG